MLAPGSLLGGTYTIVRRLSEGGMGELYEATHSRLAGRYAIKFLRREVAAAAGSPALERFKREAEITSALRHPNIVQVLDFNLTEDGHPYIVMELLDGVDLAARLEARGRLALEEVVRIVGQIASALAAAHGRGVIHRDLKPQNVFLVPLPGAQGELVKVLDFGISKVQTADSLTGEAVLVGTPYYMAPEQASGARDEIDGRTDQFALAAMAYEMLSGRRAFQGESVPAVLYKVAHEDPPPPPDVPAAVWDVVRRALSKQKAARYETITMFSDALGVAAGVLPARRRKSAATTAALAAPSGRRPRRAVATAAGIGLAAALIGMGGWWRETPHVRRDVSAAADALRRAGEAALEAQRRELERVAAEAAAVPELANAAAPGDARTLEDALESEDWWRPYRAFATAVLDGERPILVHGGPDLPEPARWALGERARSAVLPGGRRVYVAGAAAFGPGGRFTLVLARPIEPGAFGGAVLIGTSDGASLVGPPRSAGAWEARLAGHEAQGWVHDGPTDRIAVAVVAGPGLWLWLGGPAAVRE